MFLHSSIQFSSVKFYVTFKRIIGSLKLQQSGALIGLGNGSMAKADGMVDNVQVKVDKFTFPIHMIVMEW